MARSPDRAERLLCALLVCALSGAACAGCRLPRIDPSGERIFLPPEPYTVPAVSLAAPATPPAGPSVAPSAPPVAAVGPTPAGPPVAYPQPTICLSPQVVVAPVGAEVVLVAGVAGANSALAGYRVEWMLDSSGVGQLVALNNQGAGRTFLCGSGRARKINNTYAIDRTSASPYVITRGTPDPSDDVTIQAGQAWITVTSSMEGTSYVTAFAPDLGGWDGRKALARVHWVDAQWVFPPPGAGAAGARQVLTTRVTRQTDGTPVAGWHVRYEILGGSPAGFAPEGAQAVEVETDGQGNASAELFQKQVCAGATHIGVQVIRPPLPGQINSRSLILAAGTTTRSWGAPNIALKLSGPGQASPGAIATYRIDVTNPSGVASGGTVVRVERPAGLTHQDSDPAPTASGQLLEWNLGALQPAQTKSIVMRFRVGGQGTVRLCANARSASGLTARDCTDTTILLPSVDVQVLGPTQGQVGSNVRFEVVVTNRSRVPARSLIITDAFDAGLEHSVAESPIERELGDLAPGASSRIPLSFKITKPGKWCHRVDVTGAGGLRATAEACVTAAEPAPAESPQPAMEVTKTGPRQRTVGTTADFVIRVKNTGNVPLVNVRVADNYERALMPTDASEGHIVSQDAISWIFPRIDPGQTRRVRIRCKCIRAAARACNRVIVTSDGRPPIADEACLAILPAAEGPLQPEPDQAPDPAATTTRLRMTVADLADPVRLGQRATYQVLVKNEGQASDHAVKLTLTFPDGLVPARVGTKAPAPHRVDGQSIRFDAVAEIRAGETLTYLIPFQASQGGTVRVLAQLESRGQASSSTEVETTEVLEP